MQDTQKLDQFQSTIKNTEPTFSWRENYGSTEIHVKTPKAILINIRSTDNQQRVAKLHALTGEERRQFRLSNLGIYHPACIINSNNTIESFSGLIPYSIKAEYERLRALQGLLSRNPSTYMAALNPDWNRLYILFQADAVPESAEQYHAFFEAGLNLLREELGVTEDELSTVNPDPKTALGEGFDDQVWTDFYPVKLTLTPKKPPFVQSDNQVASVLSRNDTVLGGLQAERQQAQSISQQPETSITSHEQLMASLLEQIGYIDFRLLAKLDPNDKETKLKVSDYLVLVAEHVLDIAKKNHWSLCRRYAFFYLYNGAFWRVVDKDDLRRFLGQSAEQMGVKWLVARSVDFTKKLFEQFSETAYLPAPAIDKTTIKINLLNGTFKFGPNGQELCHPVAGDFLTHQLRFSYDPDAKAPLFEQFLNKVQPDKDCQKLLAEYIGYVFVSPSQLKMEKAMLLYGSGANGKSVFFEIVMGLLGTENVSNYSFEKLTTEPAYRAQIANKLLNYASEISGNLESTVFKALASGEPVEARLLYGQAFTMTDYAKLLANTNELPAAPEHSHAYFRRFLIVPFTVTIPDKEQDKQLAAKIIESELPGVFNWVLTGLRRLLEQGRFTDPVVVRQQLEMYRHQSDTVRLFMDEQAYQSDIDRYTTLQDLYREYKIYCSEDGYRPVKKLNFRKRIESYGFRTDDKNVGKVVFAVKQAKAA